VASVNRRVIASDVKLSVRTKSPSRGQNQTTTWSPEGEASSFVSTKKRSRKTVASE
ncbi:hypothetical protein LSAT2_001139, partial [Lamellibrachia satsuma]